MTVGEALEEKRRQLAGKVTELVLCKRELFYLPAPGNSPEDSVYPVTKEMAEREAKRFGVSLTEQ